MRDDIIVKLADLIDPTCTMVKELEAWDETMGCTVIDYTCSACNGSIEGQVEKPKYCPECGARVVSE